MSSLNAIEKIILDELFDMKGGFVLDFSDRSMTNFFKEQFNIDIYDEKYDFDFPSKSKANRLRGIFKYENNTVVSKIILDLISYKKLIDGDHTDYMDNQKVRKLLYQVRDLTNKLKAPSELEGGSKNDLVNYSQEVYNTEIVKENNKRMSDLLVFTLLFILKTDNLGLKSLENIVSREKYFESEIPSLEFFEKIKSLVEIPPFFINEEITFSPGKLFQIEFDDYYDSFKDEYNNFYSTQEFENMVSLIKDLKQNFDYKNIVKLLNKDLIDCLDMNLLFKKISFNKDCSILVKNIISYLKKYIDTFAKDQLLVEKFNVKKYEGQINKFKELIVSGNYIENYGHSFILEYSREAHDEFLFAHTLCALYFQKIISIESLSYNFRSGDASYFYDQIKYVVGIRIVDDKFFLNPSNDSVIKTSSHTGGLIEDFIEKDDGFGYLVFTDYGKKHLCIGPLENVPVKLIKHFLPLGEQKSIDYLFRETTKSKDLLNDKYLTIEKKLDKIKASFNGKAGLRTMLKSAGFKPVINDKIDQKTISLTIERIK